MLSPRSEGRLIVALTDGQLLRRQHFIHERSVFQIMNEKIESSQEAGDKMSWMDESTQL